MQTVYQAKEQAIADTPLLLFDCTFGNGLVEHWSSHGVSVGGVSYAARVMKQNVFEMQFGSSLGVDAIPTITIELANADSHFSEIQQSTGVKGGQLTVSMVFYSFPNGGPSSNSQMLFKGILNPPDLVTEETFRVSASNRLSLQRVVLPDIRIQKRCPWNFPVSLSQRQEAVSGGTAGPYSRYYRCGYSPDTGGTGNLASGGAAFTSCAYTRTDCTARGMFNIDSSSRTTARFGGIEFVPATILVRSAGDKGSQLSNVEDNEARYNDFVPLVYGTAWYTPGIVFARNDGNLTHFEVLLGAGQIQDIQKVLVNEIEIPIGQDGRNMTGTGWYNLVSAGQRNGSFNLDFTDANGNPLGDPYGSMAFMSLVVPNRVNDGSTFPTVQVLIDGLQLPQYGADGSSLGVSFTNNPAWVIVDLLSRIGWSSDELDFSTFAATAAYCAEEIQTTDLYGNPVTTPRFQTNLVLDSRRSAADVIRGVRNAARLFLRYGSNGLLQLVVENSIALQQPNPVPNSNAVDSLNGGWAAYEFGDGTSGTTGIARTSTGASSVKLTALSIADSPNRFVAEFQDAFNEYQQDSLSVVDPDDIASTGQEITSTTPVLGLPHYDQAARILQFYLSKSIYGNTTIEFQTSVKALGLGPGDIIAVTYLKEGFERQPFRVVKLQPGTNYRTATVTAQIHDDSWYLDTNGQTSADASRRQGAFGIGLPRPLSGVTPDATGTLQFGVIENATQAPDGTATVTATVSFASPATSQTNAPDIPLVSLAPTVSQTGGTLAGPQDLYYSVTSLAADGSESALSFVVHASLSSSTQTNSVTLTGLSFPPLAVAFQIYRGTNPSNLSRIAADQPLAVSFVDPGLPATPFLPPDPNYDHADFYWRLELQPAVTATTFSSTTIGSSILEMIPATYIGMTARIISGTGFGQERTISGNTVNVLTLSNAWDITPDSTSNFTIAQGTYQFGATTQTSPAQFTIPNQAGNVIQISGRSANCNGVEAPYEISPLTRYEIGGAGIINVDAAVAAPPTFGVSVPDNVGGSVLFGALGFPNLSNLMTVAAGTYKLFYLDELDLTPAATLAAAMAASDAQLTLAPALTGEIPAYILIDQEVMAVAITTSTATQLMVTRGLHGTTPAGHNAGASIYALASQVFIVSFGKNFFGSPASGDWTYPVSFPNVRIISAELYVTNSQGNSPTSAINFTGLQDGGLRTLSGGELAFQIAGFLAVQAGAAPDVIVDGPKVVRDVYAIVKQAPIGASIQMNINLNGVLYCSLTIADGATTVAAPVDGATLPPMKYQDQLSIDITSVGVTVPGSGLSVILRV